MALWRVAGLTLSLQSTGRMRLSGKKDLAQTSVNECGTSVPAASGTPHSDRIAGIPTAPRREVKSTPNTPTMLLEFPYVIF